MSELSAKAIRECDSPNRFSETDQSVRTEPELDKDSTGRLHIHSPNEDDREELFTRQGSARFRISIRGQLTKDEMIETIVSCTVYASRKVRTE